MTIAMFFYLLAAIGCLPANELDADACPRVYQIYGKAPAWKAINLVFIPDGFSTEGGDSLKDLMNCRRNLAICPKDMLMYRCAVGLLVHQLMKEEDSPFAKHAEMFNAYRIDLESESSGIDPAPSCQDTSCTRKDVQWDDMIRECTETLTRLGLVAPEFGKVTRETQNGPACLMKGLGTALCQPGGEDCRILYPRTTSGDDALLWAAELVERCVGPPYIMVIIANTAIKSGTGGSEPPHAVLTLYAIEQTTRHRLLSHELGHALDLFDEYDDSWSSMNYHSGRNIVSDADLTNDPDGLPWKNLCYPLQTNLSLEPNCPNHQYTGLCKHYCNVSSSDPNCCTGQTVGGQPVVGLYEGCFYNECGYFRSQNECRMKSLSDEFCVACKSYANEFLDDLAQEVPNPAP